MKYIRKYKRIITLVFVFICYIVLFYISKDNFEKLKDIDKNSLEINYFLLGAAVLLVVPNWLLEAVKWRISLQPIEKITLKTSIKGVLKGILPSVITPNRIGEAVGRPTVLEEKNKISGAFATAYCGLSQMPVMIFCATIACVYCGYSLYITLPAFLATLITGLCYQFPEYLIPFVRKKTKHKRFLGKLYFFSNYQHNEKLRLIFFSFLRYLVYSSQNCLAIIAFGVNAKFIDGLMSVFLIYAMMSFVPRPALLELGVRCSATVFVLSKYTSDFSAPTVSSVFIWCVNLLIPAILGTFFYFFEKKTKKT
ncbi:MAG: flippase-like domain-containing protein [Bacteroidales bacterium]|nr:flippase-like domain-containing protein [Bacteroidales bacterium]